MFMPFFNYSFRFVGQFQNGTIVLPKSSRKDRNQRNIKFFDFNSNVEEMQTIHNLDRITRLAENALARARKYYPINLEFHLCER